MFLTPAKPNVAYRKENTMESYDDMQRRHLIEYWALPIIQITNSSELESVAQQLNIQPQNISKALYRISRYNFIKISDLHLYLNLVQRQEEEIKIALCFEEFASEYDEAHKAA